MDFKNPTEEQPCKYLDLHAQECKGCSPISLMVRSLGLSLKSEGVKKSSKECYALSSTLLENPQTTHKCNEYFGLSPF